MNFLSMEYFLTVAAKRNITKAAEELHITQQTLSAHIAAVEKRAGLQTDRPQQSSAAHLCRRGISPLRFRDLRKLPGHVERVQ